jgi:predicted nucleic acid-binding protein
MSKESRNDDVVITDASCLILLDKIGAFPVLHHLYQNIVTTPEVAAEFGEVLPDWIIIRQVTNKASQEKYAVKVDRGEASAIALAMELVSPLLILDDLKGRKLAAQLNLNFTGTLGVFILAKKEGIIQSLREYFEKIKRTDFRVSPDLLEKILSDVGE